MGSLTHSRPADDRLESWKEIAVYLDREVRTVQRWEKQEGLPIHRHEHQKRGTVFAFRGEIDEWLRERSSAPLTASTRTQTPSWLGPVAAAALIPALLAGWWMWPQFTSPQSLSLQSVSPQSALPQPFSQRLTIAVLPFQNVGGKADFFSQGLTEELITRLGRLELADIYLQAEQPLKATAILTRLQQISTQRHVSPRLLDRLQSRIGDHHTSARR